MFGKSSLSPAVRWVGLLAVLLLPVSAVCQEALPGWVEYVEPVRRSGGTGFAAFPVTLVGGETGEFLDPSGLEIRMTPIDDPSEERAAPAGEPFAAPSGRWRYWLQGEWSMSPYSRSVTFGSVEEGAVLLLYSSLAPAGRVTVTDGSFRAGDELWLLYTGERPAERSFELSRRRPVREGQDGVLMPAGEVVAALWDPDRERYRALSRPFDLPARSVVPAPLEPPGDSVAQLIVYLASPGATQPGPHHDVELVVSSTDARHRPDFTFATGWGLHAIWYELPPGPVVLSGGNAGLYLERQSLDLSGGQIAHVDGALTRRPVLDVTLLLPSIVREGPLSLAVRKLPERELLTEQELRPQAGRHRFNLVHGLLEVTLTTHLGPFREQVDLTGVEEAFLALEPELIEVFGTVRRGSKPHPAALKFLTGHHDEVAASAGEDGRYQAYSLEPFRYASVDLLEVDQEPWEEFLMPPLDESTELDFEIPEAEVTVRVVDATTRAGIGGARVAVRSVERAPLDPAEDGIEARGRGRTFAKTYRTGGDGVARLPPPRRGHLELSAHAEGYRQPGDDLVVEIEDESRDRNLELVLEPAGERLPLRLILPDGSPAAGAEVLRISSLSPLEILFSDRADAEGIVEVPVAPGTGLLLLKPAHAGAAFGLVEWASLAREAGLDGVQWTFPQAAERPLTLRTMDPTGQEPQPAAELALEVAGFRLSGAALRVVLGAPPRSDQNGYWSAAGVPRAPVAVVAWVRSTRDQAVSGALDALATEVPYPWPDEFEIPVIR